MTRRLSVAIVGAGLMGRWHADAAARAGGRVVAIVDPDVSSAERLAKMTDASRTYRDLSEASDLDVVHICTPPATHEGLTRRAIDAGSHVLVEKPMAPDAATVEALIGCAQAKGVLICPVHQFLFQDGVQSALRRVGSLGPLQHVAITICSAGAAHLDDARRQVVALEILSHPLSLLRLFLAPDAAGALPDADWSIRRPAAGEIRALTLFDGVTASIVVSMSGRPPINRMEIIGARGTTRVDLFHGFSITAATGTSRVSKIVRPFGDAWALGAGAAANLAKRAWRREPAYPGLRSLVERFYGAVAAGGPSPISPADAVWTARMRDALSAALESAQAPARLAP